MKKLVLLILIALVSQSTIAQKKIWDETWKKKISAWNGGEMTALECLSTGEHMPWPAGMNG